MAISVDDIKRVLIRNHVLESNFSTAYLGETAYQYIMMNLQVLAANLNAIRLNAAREHQLDHCAATTRGALVILGDFQEISEKIYESPDKELMELKITLLSLLMPQQEFLKLLRSFKDQHVTPQNISNCTALYISSRRREIDNNFAELMEIASAPASQTATLLAKVKEKMSPPLDVSIPEPSERAPTPQQEDLAQALGEDEQLVNEAISILLEDAFQDPSVAASSSSSSSRYIQRRHDSQRRHGGPR